MRLAPLPETAMSALNLNMDTEADLLSYTQSLCTYEYNQHNDRNEYHSIPDTLQSLRGLESMLRHDPSHSQPIHCKLGEWCVMRTSLLPLLITYRNDYSIVLPVLKLCVRLTMPLSSDCETLAVRLKHLQSMKNDFLATDSMIVLSNLIAPLIYIQPKLRTKDQFDCLELTLTLIKQLLLIPEFVNSNNQFSSTLTVHLKFIIKCDDELILSLLQYLAMRCRQYSDEAQRFGLIVLECVSAIVKNQEPEILVHGKQAQSLAQAQSQSAIPVNSRHSRFGTLIQQTNTALFPKQPRFIVNTANADRLDSDKLQISKGRKPLQQVKDVNLSSASLVTGKKAYVSNTATTVIKNFMVSFVSSGAYDALMCCVNQELKANVRIVKEDEKNWMVTAATMTGTYREQMEFDRKQKLSISLYDSDGTKPVIDLRCIYSTLSVECFSLLHSKLEQYALERPIPISHLTAALLYYREIVHCLSAMLQCGDSASVQYADECRRTFYSEKKHFDFLVSLFRMWHSHTHTQAILEILMECVHFSMLVLDDIDNKHTVIAKRKKAVRKFKTVIVDGVKTKVRIEDLAETLQAEQFVNGGKGKKKKKGATGDGGGNAVNAIVMETREFSNTPVEARPVEFAQAVAVAATATTPTTAVVATVASVVEEGAPTPATIVANNNPIPTVFPASLIAEPTRVSVETAVDSEQSTRAADDSNVIATAEDTQPLLTDDVLDTQPLPTNEMTESSAETHMSLDCASTEVAIETPSSINVTSMIEATVDIDTPPSVDLQMVTQSSEFDTATQSAVADSLASDASIVNRMVQSHHQPAPVDVALDTANSSPTPLDEASTPVEETVTSTLTEDTTASTVESMLAAEATADVSITESAPTVTDVDDENISAGTPATATITNEETSNTGTDSDDDSDDGDLGEGYYIQQTAFNFQRYVHSYCHPTIINHYITVLTDSYQSLSPPFIEMIVRMLERIAFDHELIVMFYQLAVFNMCDKVLSDRSIHHISHYKPLRSFCKKVVYQFFVDVKRQPLLFMELLCWKSAGHVELMKNDYVAVSKKSVKGVTVSDPNGQVSLEQFGDADADDDRLWREALQRQWKDAEHKSTDGKVKRKKKKPADSASASAPVTDITLGGVTLDDSLSQFPDTDTSTAMDAYDSGDEIDLEALMDQTRRRELDREKREAREAKRQEAEAKQREKERERRALVDNEDDDEAELSINTDIGDTSGTATFDDQVSLSSWISDGWSIDDLGALNRQYHLFASLKDRYHLLGQLIDHRHTPAQIKAKLQQMGLEVVSAPAPAPAGVAVAKRRPNTTNNVHSTASSRPSTTIKTKASIPKFAPSGPGVHVKELSGKLYDIVTSLTKKGLDTVVEALIAQLNECAKQRKPINTDKYPQFVLQPSAWPDIDDGDRARKAVAKLMRSLLFIEKDSGRWSVQKQWDTEKLDQTIRTLERAMYNTRDDMKDDSTEPDMSADVSDDEVEAEDDSEKENGDDENSTDNALADDGSDEELKPRKKSRHEIVVAPSTRETRKRSAALLEATQPVVTKPVLETLVVEDASLAEYLKQKRAKRFDTTIERKQQSHVRITAAPSQDDVQMIDGSDDSETPRSSASANTPKASEGNHRRRVRRMAENENSDSEDDAIGSSLTHTGEGVSSASRPKKRLAIFDEEESDEGAPFDDAIAESTSDNGAVASMAVMEADSASFVSDALMAIE